MTFVIAGQTYLTDGMLLETDHHWSSSPKIVLNPADRTAAVSIRFMDNISQLLILVLKIV